MKISTETMNFIYKYKEWGDMSKIAEQCGRSVPTITAAIKNRSASAEVIEAITAFYEQAIPVRIAAAKRLEDINRINKSNEEQSAS